MNSNPSVMRAVVFDGELRFAEEYPVPEPATDWARVRILKAGICATDLELMKGYMGFKGVLGHEFVGIVHQSHASAWRGKRVAGEINAACGRCQRCRQNLGRHCPDRKVLGIQALNGCMADFCVLPVSNLHEIPSHVPDERAIFLEPLAAACEILEQLPLKGSERVLVLGDGRLGILCAWTLATVVSDITLIGHHSEKLTAARWRHLKTALDTDGIAPGADIVVEATGSAGGMEAAMSLCRPRGTIVLKTTVASWGDIDLAPIVINELTVVGSRCGQYQDGLKMLKNHPDLPVERLITARYPLEQAAAAFEHAARPEALKVLIEMT